MQTQNNYSNFGLLLDCSANPYLVGLLDLGSKSSGSTEWIAFSTCDYKIDLHQFIFEVLAKNKLNLNSIDIIFVNHGPGSYTGLRQSFIFSETLKLEGKSVYTFYHYDALKIAKAKKILDSDFYVANAFKNSFFLQNLESEEEGEVLLLPDLQSRLKEDQKIVGKTHSEYESFPCFQNIDRIYQDFPQLFNELKNEKFLKLNPIHYFRPADVEFPNFQKK